MSTQLVDLLEKEDQRKNCGETTCLGTCTYNVHAKKPARLGGSILIIASD